MNLLIRPEDPLLGNSHGTVQELLDSLVARAFCCPFLPALPGVRDGQIGRISMSTPWQNSASGEPQSGGVTCSAGSSGRTLVLQAQQLPPRPGNIPTSRYDRLVPRTSRSRPYLERDEGQAQVARCGQPNTQVFRRNFYESNPARSYQHYKHSTGRPDG